MFAIALLLVGVISRILVHTPNFNPVIALALFGGMYLKKRDALWMPLALMIISDLLLGLHNTIFFTWGSVLLISMMGSWQKENKAFSMLAVKTLAAPVLFFLVTNFGSWLAMYPKTIDGLIQCYIAAIPFFRNSLVSAILYSVVLIASYEFVTRRVRETKLGWIV